MSNEIDRGRRAILRFGVTSAGVLVGGRWLAACAPEPSEQSPQFPENDASAASATSDADVMQNSADAGAITDSASGPVPSEPDAGAAVDDVPEYSYDGPPGPADMFQHGVASGDPESVGIILWTRVTAPGNSVVPVFWEIARDTLFVQRIQAGSYDAREDRDFTVKIDVRKLEPGQVYYYRFKSLGRTSPVGRTRTAPAGSAQQVRFAVVSCASLAHGYFHVYRSLAAEANLDAVIHLGDYIYEYGNGEYGSLRNYEPPHEALTLADYRTRHAQYKRDKDVQEVHRQHAFIAVWDDHESANDAYRDGAQNHSSAEGSWPARRDAAVRAYREWLPVRDTDDALKQWRTQSYGDLLDLVMLDTRLWGRTKQQPPESPPDPKRSLLGADQESWLADQLFNSSARWKLIGQQVMMASIGGLNNDQWTGYPAARKEVLELFRDLPGANVVVLTGDIHSAWANELKLQPNDPRAVAVEFVTPSVTSPGGLGVFAGLSTEVRWADPGDDHGYVVLDVTRERVQAAWFVIDDVTSPSYRPTAFRTAWSVADGERSLRQDGSAAIPLRDGPPPAP